MVWNWKSFQTFRSISQNRWVSQLRNAATTHSCWQVMVTITAYRRTSTLENQKFFNIVNLLLIGLQRQTVNLRSFDVVCKSVRLILTYQKTTYYCTNFEKAIRLTTWDPSIESHERQTDVISKYWQSWSTNSEIVLWSVEIMYLCWPVSGQWSQVSENGNIRHMTRSTCLILWFKSASVGGWVTEVICVARGGTTGCPKNVETFNNHKTKGICSILKISFDFNKKAPKLRFWAQDYY